MPLTPVHLGPGAAFKAIGGQRFSFVVFGGSQVLMDIEPLVGIIKHKPILHGYTHTILGAVLIGLVAGAIGRPISLFVLKLSQINHDRFTWATSFVSAFIGTFSHIGFDAVMHADMNPFWPIAEGNPLLGLVTVGSLHIFCIALGLLGLFIIAGKAIFYGQA